MRREHCLNTIYICAECGGEIRKVRTYQDDTLNECTECGVTEGSAIELPEYATTRKFGPPPHKIRTLPQLQHEYELIREHWGLHGIVQFLMALRPEELALHEKGFPDASV